MFFVYNIADKYNISRRGAVLKERKLLYLEEKL